MKGKGMIREEIRIVKRRLDDYQCYKVLALEADKKALLTQCRIDEAGVPRSPGWGKIAPTQNHIELSSILNSLISDLCEYERDAASYHQRMDAIESYIDKNYAGDIRKLMRLHYIDGVSYDDLEDEICLTRQAMSIAVARAMEDVDFAAAKEIL